MKLAHHSVTNYRALREVNVPLSQFVYLTGENNAGKSSVLQAISLFLTGTSLAPHNFFDPAQPITMAVRLEALSESDLARLIPDHRTRIEPLVHEQTLTLVRGYGTDGKSQIGYFGRVASAEEFQDSAIEALVIPLLVWEFAVSPHYPFRLPSRISNSELV